LIVIGGGPAGYTAALYAARANLEPLVIEGFAWGGQLMITSDVENYPGYAEGVLGPQMMQDFRRQAERFGAEFVTDDVTKVDFSEHPLRVWVGEQEHAAESVIVATGASARQLGLESERTLQGRGVSYCAVCDAAFFRDKEVVVVGGGDSAMEEAIFLTKFATKVSLVHRRSEFRASQIMEDRARNNDKIEFVTPYVVEEVLGENGATSGVRLRDLDTDDTRDLPAQGLFVAIGHDPNTKLFLDQLDHDEQGYLVTKAGSTETNVEGVFAAGDVVDHTYRQAVTAAGSGAMAALDAERWLAAREWIDLLDPSEAELRTVLGREIHDRALEQLLRPARHDDEPRPRLEGHDQYVFGVFLVPIAIREEDRVFYQEVDLVATRERLVTVRKAPEGGHPLDLGALQAAPVDDDRAGMLVYRLVDLIAEYFLDLVDALNDEIDELEEGIEVWTSTQIRQRMSALRHDLLHVRRTVCRRVMRSGAWSTAASTSARAPRCCRATSSSTSRTCTTSCYARWTGSTSRATCSRAPATTTRRRSPTTRTRW
jgi:thioredoxin reductase (NADPH)